MFASAGILWQFTLDLWKEPVGKSEREMRSITSETVPLNAGSSLTDTQGRPTKGQTEKRSNNSRSQWPPPYVKVDIAFDKIGAIIPPALEESEYVFPPIRETGDRIR